MRETKLVLLAADLAGYTKACAHLDALSIAQFLDRWYRQASPIIESRDGRVVKFMGDGVFAVFPVEAAVAAVDAASALREAVKCCEAMNGTSTSVRTCTSRSSPRARSGPRTATTCSAAA